MPVMHIPVAYIDPNAGSFFFQILIAGFLGGLYAVKVFWKNIVLQLSKLFRKAK